MRLKKMDGWTEEGSRKKSREEGRVVSSRIHTSDPEASISAQRGRSEGDGSAGWRCREENKLSSAEMGGREDDGVNTTV